MKKGSLVICIHTCLGLNSNGESFGEIIVKGRILTIRYRGLSTFKKTPIIYFEEIVNGQNKSTGKEYGYPVCKFKELLPPMDLEISELLKEKKYATM